MLPGVVIAPVFRAVPNRPAFGAPHSGRETGIGERGHCLREVAAATAPALSMRVDKDTMEGWNLTPVTGIFTFMPEHTGGSAEPNTGHAHRYIDGMIIAVFAARISAFPISHPGQHDS